MPKLLVDGKLIEYDQDELMEAVEILREDSAIKALGSIREQQKEMAEWMKSQQQAREDKGNADGEPTGNSGANAGANSGADNPEPDNGTGTMGNANPGNPAPPPPLTDAEREQQKPQRKKSRWWGDAISYEDGE